MKILVLYQSVSGCDYHRVYLPIRYFPMQNGDKVFLINENQPIYEETFSDIDIVFFNRLPHFITNDKLFELKRKFGFKLIVDIDDYWELYYHHELYNNWKHNKVSERIVECLINAEVVITTNEQLWKKAKQLNENVVILPNAVPVDLDQFAYNYVEHKKFNVIYTGGSSHLSDLKTISGFFRRLGSDGNWIKNGNFIFGGYNNPTNSQSNVYWKMLGVVKPIKNFTLEPPRTVHSYMSLYDNCDVSIAPLEFNEFNECKSILKIIEAGSKKIPIVCSDKLPYMELDGVQGVTTCHSSGDFYSKIKYFLRNPWKCQEDGLALYEYIKDYFNYSEINKQRYDVFKSVL